MGLLFGSVLMDLLVLVAAAAAALYWYFTRNFDYWEKRGVPFIKPIPFFGTMKDLILMRRHPGEIMQGHYNTLEGHKFGGTFSFASPVLLIRDPELVKSVLVKDFAHFQDRGMPVNPKLNPLSQHLFNINGPIWKSLRVKLSPTFTSGKMKMMFHAVEECARNLQLFLKDAADKEEVLELKDVLAKFSTDVIGTCAFGLQLNSLDGGEGGESEFRAMGKKIFEAKPSRFLRVILNIFLPKIASVLRVPDLEKDIVDFFMKAVKETVDYREKNNVKRNDFLQLMIELRNKGKIEGEEDEMEDVKAIGKGDDLHLDDGLFASQAFVFFIAGFETSSTTMSFALHELAINPDVQTRLREEIDSALEQTGGKMTYDVVMGMKYLDQVVSETLRKFPPVTNLRRVVTIPHKLPGMGFELPKDMVVIIPAYALQHDPKYYPDPDRFDPERFSDENKAKRPHYTFLPFGEGPRNCIGMRFGLLQTKMGLVSLLSKYEFHVCERTEVPITLNPRSLITASTTGTILRITNRQ